MNSQGQADPVSESSPNLYTKPSNTSTDPVSDLRHVLKAIEAKRQRLASALDPSESVSEELLDALLQVVDVRCDARSELPLRDFTTLVEHLRKSPDLVRAVSSLAALGPEYDPASDVAAWCAVRERRSTPPAISNVYLRSYPATFQDHLAWSHRFEQLFPASALEEVSFRARLATLDPELIIRRFYGEWTTRDPLIRAEEDYELIRKLELNTRHGQFMRSIGGWPVEQQEIYCLNLSPTSVEPSLAEKLTGGYETLIVAALGSEGFNSASGGNKTRWTPNKRLLQDRDRITAVLRSRGPTEATGATDERHTAVSATASSFYPALRIESSHEVTAHEVTAHGFTAPRSMHGPPEPDSPPLPRTAVLPRPFDKPIVGHFTDFQHYFDSNISPSGYPQDSRVGRKYLEEMVLAARTAPVNSYHEPVAVNVLESVMSSTGESDFPNGSGNRLYLKDTQGYKSWSQRAFINLRADKVWDVVNQSIDSLVADYRSTLVIAHATALTSVQVADKVAEYRERAIRRNDLACKYISNSISEEQMSHLIHLTSAYEMWDTLRGLHSHGRPSRTMDLLNTLAQP
ncbi:BQ5605_C007g04401 [Microbotryum silenes-dioicae]|uniref:BQ5605_C007g04401 protein n=1 Tax=Microbotryum silenes-dioicae TaxID=796604 RepID=A0A2X0N135_9BASI|nr:BQ5605_C007g04401 [Microbotryum silenes-dioicae]